MTNTIGATPEERELIEKLRDTGNRSGYSQTMLVTADTIESLISDRAKLREALGDARCRFLFFESMIGISGTAARHAENGIKRIDAALNITKGQSNGE